MNTAIKTFLTELYEIDPDLKEHEADLIPLIEKLLSEDPAQAPDEAFVQRLRMQLQEHASHLSYSSMKTSNWTNFFYALSGAITVAVLLPVAYLGFQQGSEDTATPLFGYQVEEEGKRAFGDLAGVNANSQGMGGGERTQSGGGGGAVPSPALSAIGGGGIANDTDAKMMIYPAIQYDYSYTGEYPELASSVDVLRRIPDAKRIPLSTISSKLNLGTIDLNSFSGMDIDSVSFNQNTAFGYQIYVSMRDATASINANWEKWPQSKCETEACFRAEQVTVAQIPADDVLIGIAKAFASEHGIDLSTYGEPEVDAVWKRDYERAADTSLAYVPDVQRVTFPFLVDGKPTYDQSGQKNGISIGVNVKHKKVSDVWGIMDRTYQKSSYDGVTETATITEHLSKMNSHFNDLPPGDVKKVKIILDTPQVGYAMYYRWADNQNQELLVPSLIFPVKEAQGATDGYYPSTVVVPLAKEMLTEMNKQPPVMPLIMEDTVKATDAAAE